MLFHMLQTYPNITKAVINDINPDLIEYKRDLSQKIKDLGYLPSTEMTLHETPETYGLPF